MDVPEDCFTCRQEARGIEGAPWEAISGDGYWRVAHAIGTSIVGWLVLVPRRHVTTLAELTDDEAAALGSWQVRLSRALHEATGCVKTYVAQFAEAEGFAHVHFHVVPRPPGLAAERRGPGIFAAASGRRPGVPEAEMDALALRLRALLGG
ncbi:MAG: HIT domain-containing protein [Streptomycetaceae bacterium]|nr:HIT domain-containing protein [Streptomycetaceae bacterium]